MIKEDTLKTKFGKARLDKGYYKISTSKEGNHNKRLHRLIFEEHYGVTLLPNVVIHHIDGNSFNNEISNLEMMYRDEHTILHNLNRPKEIYDKVSSTLKGKEVSAETRKKLSLSKMGEKNPAYGKHHSLDQCKKISSANNSTGIFRVQKSADKSCKQGFLYVYFYYDGGKHKKIRSTNILKLKKKVLDKGLPWEILDEEKARKTIGNQTSLENLFS